MYVVSKDEYWQSYKQPPGYYFQTKPGSTPLTTVEETKYAAADPKIAQNFDNAECLHK